jgi:tight adherence protein B
MTLLTTLLILLSSLLLLAAVALGLWGIGPYWDLLAARQMGLLAERFRRLGLSEPQLQFCLRMWGLLLVGWLFVVGVLLRMPPVAVVSVGLIYLAPRHILDFLICRRERILRHQLVAATVAMGNAVKAGLSLAQAIENVSRETPLPLRNELTRIVRDFERGRPLKEAIEQVRGRLQLEAFTLFALAIETALERGGRVNQSLERISNSLLENQRLERKLEAETSAGRQVVLILACFPAGFAGLLYLLDATSTALLFTTLAGQFVLCAAMLLVYAGSNWAAHIMRFES